MVGISYLLTIFQTYHYTFLIINRSFNKPNAMYDIYHHDHVDEHGHVDDTNQGK